MQQVAATARPRGPERSPQPEPGDPDKKRMQHRFATMAQAAERDPKIEQRIKDREKAARKMAGATAEPRRTRQEAQKDDRQQIVPVPAQWDSRSHVNLPAPLANTHHLVPARELHDRQTALPFDWGRDP